ncbi:3-methyladenine DNA glycosylase [Schumannella luteola]|uniref:3-methyladenine DNA glycosylase/8-oxoguanine DNA glycosylase n=1 Tax=Schumannella luteola TaxID=472059 RepID=A0A852YKZ3_9MICO|nr:DNA-3-methyladenine glycosylase 2 family protein [Schumannella luteola]NYG97865.1 3-methyladenine DNA glycosylase/8-oxoguanine DNA glycosylase [Schumannella luteola]
MSAVEVPGAPTPTPASAVPLSTRYAPPHPIDLRRTLGTIAQFGSDPASRREGEAHWLVFRAPAERATAPTADDGAPVTLRLRVDAAAASVHADAWGPGAAWAIERVPALLGADDDLDGFDAERHPLIAELHRRAPGLRLARTGQVLAALLPAIFFQKVTGQEASRSWRTLVARHGEPAPGPAPRGMHVLPTVAAWRRIPSWEWHRAGVTPQRRDTIQRALAVATGLERGGDQPVAEAQRRLRTVPGIGVWTTAETVQRSHGAPDAVSFGDFHTCKNVGWALTGARVDDDGMRELLEPWRGHRQRVVRLIEGSGIGYERRGPRLTIPDHRAR